MNVLELAEKNTVVCNPESAKERLEKLHKLSSMEQRQFADEMKRLEDEANATGHYPTFDMDAALAMRKTMKGIGFQVPAFIPYKFSGSGYWELHCEQAVDKRRNARLTLVTGVGGGTKYTGMHPTRYMDIAETFGDNMLSRWELHRSGVRNFYNFGGGPELGAMATLFVAMFVALPNGYIRTGVACGIAAAVLLCWVIFLVNTWAESQFQLSLILRHDFTGVVPEHVRNSIAEAEKRGYTAWILEESHTFQVNQEKSAQPRDKDPLVVGLRGGAWYLIDKFDVTPAEEFIAKELSA